MTTIRRTAFVLCVAALLPAAAHAAGAQSGLWLSEGYGYFFDIAVDTLRADEITGISFCRAISLRAATPPSRRRSRFSARRSAEGSPAPIHLEDALAETVASRTGGGAHRRLDCV